MKRKSLLVTSSTASRIAQYQIRVRVFRSSVSLRRNELSGGSCASSKTELPCLVSGHDDQHNLDCSMSSSLLSELMIGGLLPRGSCSVLSRRFLRHNVELKISLTCKNTAVMGAVWCRPAQLLKLAPYRFKTLRFLSHVIAVGVMSAKAQSRDHGGVSVRRTIFAR